MPRKRRVLEDRANVRPVALVGASAGAVVAIARRIAEYWPVIHVNNLASLGGEAVAGIVFADDEALQSSSPADYTAPVAVASGASRELEGLLAHVLARHYIRIEAVAVAVREFVQEHQLTLRQANMMILFCTELSREEIRGRLGITENTIKSHIRILCRHVDAPLGTAQLAQRILRRAAQTSAERAEPDLPVAPTPNRSLGTAPSVEPRRPGLVEPGAPPPSPMALLRQLVPDILQALPLSALPKLSTKLRKVAGERGIETVGSLLGCDDLSKHLSGSLAKSCERLLARADALKDCKLDADTLLVAFENRVQLIENDARRDALLRRSGLKGSPERLIDVAQQRGVSRQRVRQLEIAAIDEVLSVGFDDLIRSRVLAAWNGAAMPLETLARARWFNGVDKPPGRQVLWYLLPHVFPTGDGPGLGDIDGEPMLLPQDRHGVITPERAYRELRQRLSTLKFPLSKRELMDAAQAAQPNHPLQAQLIERLCDEVFWAGSGRQRLAYGFVDSQADVLLAHLRASPRPMLVSELVERVGARVAALPDEVLHFERGTLGLEKHFPRFQEWRERLAPRCLKVMRSAPDRQWSADELLGTLSRDGVVLPRDCNVWHVVALLRRTPGLRYLGRRRFVLADAAVTSRKYVRDAVREVLEAAEGPLTKDQIIAALKPRMAVRGQHVTHALKAEDFRRVSDGWQLARGSSKVANG